MSRSAPFFAALLLAACNSQPAPQIVPAGPASPVAPPSVRLPDGSACAAAIARWRAIQENDHATGHVNESVYTAIQGEIADAESACAAGQDARATGLVRASKARHGYPADWKQSRLSGLTGDRALLTLLLRRNKRPQQVKHETRNRPIFPWFSVDDGRRLRRRNHTRTVDKEPQIRAGRTACAGQYADRDHGENLDTTPEEFESKPLKAEKVIAAAARDRSRFAPSRPAATPSSASSTRTARKAC